MENANFVLTALSIAYRLTYMIYRKKAGTDEYSALQ